VLAAMHRGHRREVYYRLAERLRAARPDLALSSDFIVGFPGETDADFDATMALVADIGFASAFSFKYSARPGTPAAALRTQVPENVKAARLAALQSLLASQQQAFNTAKLGAVMPVLLQDAGRKPGQLIGKSPWLQSVHLDAPAGLVGRIVDARIDSAHPNSLGGAIVRPDAGSQRSRRAVLAA